MARVFVNASSQYLTVAGSPLSTVTPVTFSAWIKPDSVAASGPQGFVITVSRSDGSNRIDLRQQDTDPTVVWWFVDPVGATLPAVLTAGAWQHVAGVSASTTSHIAYRNGTGSGVGTGTATASAMNQTDIGRWSGGATYGFNGLIAECAIWNVGLSAGQITALAAGDSPMSIATLPLRYWRFKEDLNFTDLASSVVLTNSGTTFSSDHPTVADPPAPTIPLPPIVMPSHQFPSSRR